MSVVVVASIIPASGAKVVAASDLRFAGTTEESYAVAFESELRVEAWTALDELTVFLGPEEEVSAEVLATLGSLVEVWLVLLRLG